MKNMVSKEASVHTTIIAMQYARTDSVRCLNGRYTAYNLSHDIKVAVINDAIIEMLSAMA